MVNALKHDFFIYLYGIFDLMGLEMRVVSFLLHLTPSQLFFGIVFHIKRRDDFHTY